MFSECLLEGYQSDPTEDRHHGSELANSVPIGSKSQVVSCFVQSQADRDKTWENFWVKKGMPLELVYFWRRHDWSWEIAEATEGLRKCFDKKGFLFEDHATTMEGSSKF